jgi:hypothetical protein
MRRLAAASLAIALAGQTAAQEPLTFKGLALGATQEQFKAVMPGIECTPTMCHMLLQAQCRGLRGFDEIRACQRQFDYGGQVVLWLSGDFEEGGLMAINARLDTRAFKPLLEAMVERFGAPTADEPRTVQNRMGASFDDRRVTWIRGDALLVLRQRSSKLDEAAVSLVSQSFLKRQRERSEQKAKERAKQL